MKRITKSACVAAALISVAGVVLAGRGIDDTLTRLDDGDPALLAEGEAVYFAQCAACHGEALEGQANWRERTAAGLLPAPPHDASGHTWHHADDLLFEIVKYGPAAVVGDPKYASAMPAYEGLLSDREIIAVLSWIKSTWPEDERGWQGEVNAAALEQLGINEGKSILDRLLK